MKTIALFVAFAAVTLSQSVVHACCAPPESAISAHFRALNRHDRTGMLNHWNENAIVVSVGKPTTIEPIDRAATRWMKESRTFTFHVDKIDESSDEDTATAHVSVTADGKKLEDTILLRFGNHGWRIERMTIAAAPPPVTASAY